MNALPSPERDRDLPWSSFRFFSGEKSYEEIWAFQKALVEQVAQNKADEALIFCEHELCVTAGKRAQESNLLVSGSGIKVYQIERGGDYTLHSPGQLVMYPIMRLGGRLLGRGIHEYLRFLEDVLIRVFSENFSFEAGRFGPTGVWIRDSEGVARKLASIGIAVRRWVTYHGVAINVSNDLGEFSRIRPCNFEASVMTSLRDQGVDIPLPDLADLLEKKFNELILCPATSVD